MTSHHSEDSLKKRYAYKVVNNILGLALNVVTQAIIPRSLGPALYGGISFLNAFFTQVIGFFEAGSSLGFFSRLSRRPDEAGVIRFYWGYHAVICFLSAALTAVVFATGNAERFWPGQPAELVWMSLGFVAVVTVTQILNQIVDAHGFTVRGEISRNWQRAFSLAVLLGLYFSGRLGAVTFFLYSYASFGLLGALWARDLRRAGQEAFPARALEASAIRAYGREFYEYTSPLLVYTLLGAVANVVDRWFLQIVAGSVQQGYFGFSFQLSTLIFVFTGAMTPLLTREFSRAHGRGDMERLRFLFARTIPALSVTAAAIGVFFAFTAADLGVLMGGAEFKAAGIAVNLMMLYPVHQTIGQLCGSFFYSTGQTRAYRNLGIGALVAGFPMTYLFLAPRSGWGLELGAVGLALKMLIVQFIGVNLLLWHNTRTLGLRFSDFLARQFAPFLLFAPLALAAIALGRSIGSPFARLSVCALIYFPAVAGLLYAVPSVWGGRREDIHNLLRRGTS